MTNATPTKLRSGDWGARIIGNTETGEIIQIWTRSGKTWLAEVVKVVWTGTDRDGRNVAIVATRSVDRPPRNNNTSYESYECDNCGSGRATRTATDSSGIRGRVCNGCYGPSYELSFG